MTTITAIFENGVFRPRMAPNLPEGTEVKLTVLDQPEFSEIEVISRIKSAKTLDELWAARDQSLDLIEPDYDLEKQLQANRLWSEGTP